MKKISILDMLFTNFTERQRSLLYNYILGKAPLNEEINNKEVFNIYDTNCTLIFSRYTATQVLQSLYKELGEKVFDKFCYRFVKMNSVIGVKEYLEFKHNLKNRRK